MAVIAFCNKVPCNISESVSLVFHFRHKGMGWTARCEFVGARARLIPSQRKMEQYLSWFLRVLFSLKRWQRCGEPDWLLVVEKISHKRNHEERGERHKELGVRWEQRKPHTGEVSLVFPQNVVPERKPYFQGQRHSYKTCVIPPLLKIITGEAGGGVSSCSQMFLLSSPWADAVCRLLSAILGRR